MVPLDTEADNGVASNRNNRQARAIVVKCLNRSLETPITRPWKASTIYNPPNPAKAMTNENK